MCIVRESPFNQFVDKFDKGKQVIVYAVCGGRQGGCSGGKSIFTQLFTVFTYVCGGKQTCVDGQFTF